MVCLRLVPYQQMSLASQPFHKLQPRFYGPYEILAMIGLVAYKLKLPETSKLHPVFHVSCLKKHLGATVQPISPLPIITDAGIIQDVPLAILDRRMIKKGNTAIIEFLVHWKNHSAEEATWGPYSDLRIQFPEVVHL